MILYTFCHFNIEDCFVKTMGISLFISGIMIFISIICRSIFISKVIKNFSFSFNCNVQITNEFINNENKISKSFIVYSAIYLGADDIFLTFNAFTFIISLRNYRKTKSIYDYSPFNYSYYYY